MKKATVVVPAPFDQGRIFDLTNPVLNRDNFLAFFYFLKQSFAKYGYDLSTQDIHSIEESDVVIYRDLPKILPEARLKNKCFLLVYESEVIRPDNFDRANHQNFKKVFTWHDGWVDNKTYFKFNFAHLRPPLFEEWQNRPQFAALIAGNKVVEHPLELYSKRIETIRWFEKHHPGELDLYGIGWESISVNVHAKNLIQKILNKISPALGFMPGQSFPSYKGAVESKMQTLSQYQFAICYENAEEIPGYITEKIFDCFFAGCIPVYWGAPNIRDFIPASCFIDRQRFKSHEDLREFLLQLKPSELLQYQRAIQQFLTSSQFDLFDAEKVAETVCVEILRNYEA